MVEEGKNMIMNCLQKSGIDTDIDTLICYKTGNKKSASEYNNNSIGVKLTKQDKESLNKGAQYIVKYFINMDIFAAFKYHNGNMYVYKKDLEYMEKNPKIDYKDFVVGSIDKIPVYMFRGESGIDKFIKKNLLAK